jgi:hypothetical protein
MLSNTGVAYSSGLKIQALPSAVYHPVNSTPSGISTKIGVSTVLP